MLTGEIGACPNCGAKKVRTGQSYALHLARLANGTRRRYCPVCGRRWKAPDKICSRSARLCFILPFTAAALYLLASVVYEIRLAPQSVSEMAWQLSPAEMWEADALQRGDVAGTYGAALGGSLYGTDNMYARQLAGAAQSQDPAALLRRLSQGGQARRSGQSQELLDFMRLAASAGMTPQQIASEVDSNDKQTLWEKYGNKFSSKDEAKAAYDKFQSRRGEIPK